MPLVKNLRFKAYPVIAALNFPVDETVIHSHGLTTFFILSTVVWQHAFGLPKGNQEGKFRQLICNFHVQTTGTLPGNK